MVGPPTIFSKEKSSGLVQGVPLPKVSHKEMAGVEYCVKCSLIKAFDVRAEHFLGSLFGGKHGKRKGRGTREFVGN